MNKNNPPRPIKDILKRSEIAEQILRESENMVSVVAKSSNIQALESQIYEIESRQKPNEKISVRLKVVKIAKVHSDIQIHKKIPTDA